MKTWEKLHNNPSLWKRYFIREKVLTAIRRFFFDRGFHEIETPYLTGSLPPEFYLDVFETTLYSRDRTSHRMFLSTSPEPYIKKLLVAGIGNCFAICKNFRNTEDISTIHTPEFSVLEWYRVNANYEDIMRDCEELIVYINTYLHRMGDSQKEKRSAELMYQGKKVNLAAPWERLSMCEAFKKYAKIDLTRVLTLETLASVAAKKGYKIEEHDTWEEIFHQIFLNEVESHLGRGKPTIIYDYPMQLAALSRKKKSDPRFAERFEFYIEGLELGNAYSELTDAKEQLARFENEQEERKRLGKIEHPVDMDFISALKVGMPKAGGVGVGVDRLIMLLADVADIADTLFFPMKELINM
jgi:elongation factor P--(R)-beta-lysine ligase